MSDEHKPEWLDEFENLANEQLDDGSACEQIHPIVASWYEEVMSGDPPESRDSVWQALRCLTTEVLGDMPPEIADMLEGKELDEELSDWITEVLLVGRAFQLALDKGRLDDL
ncbi:MAG TPA: hypothetical protein VHP83_27120 [Aggregatilineaceae bacterium]|nr:hypothetical protein [Aggregatilineaceae bacterium]